jgi:hypothetical protein
MRLARINCPHCGKSVVVRDAGSAELDPAAVDKIFEATDSMFKAVEENFKKIFSLRLWKS